MKRKKYENAYNRQCDGWRQRKIAQKLGQDQTINVRGMREKKRTNDGKKIGWFMDNEI